MITASAVNDLYQTVRRVRQWCPCDPSPKQLAFLSMRQEEVLYGGAAGGGKSFANLMAALEFFDQPGYSALILRKTFADLSKPGALIPISHEWLGGKATWNAQLKQWTSPAGSTLSFGYLENANDHYQYQGARYHYVGFDELTQFPEYQYEYLFSRLRRTAGSSIPIRMRAGANPGGIGHQWVFERFLEKGNSLERAFLPASLDDNPFLDKEDYDRQLRKLNPVEYARLRWGDWNVRRQGLVFPDFESCVVDFDSLPDGTYVGGIDYGFNNPFAAIRGVLDHDDVLWLDYERYVTRTAISEHARHLPRDTSKWYADPAGADQTAELIVAGHPVWPSPHHGKNPILTGIDRVNNRITSKRLRIHPKLKAIRREAGIYHYPDNKLTELPVDSDNHALAALRYLVVGLDRWKTENTQGDEQGPTRADYEAKKAQAEWGRIDNPAFW